MHMLVLTKKPCSCFCSLEGLHYKAFLATERTSAAELVDKALERSHIVDNPLHYCIWQVASANTGDEGEISHM